MRVFILFLISMLVVGCGGEKFNPSESAERFFTLVQNGNAGDAYEQSSVAFKFNRSKKYFKARAHDLGLDSIKAKTFGPATAKGDVMRLRGTFTLKDDTTLELNLGFVEENGTWKIAEAKRDPDSDGFIEDVFAVESRSRDTAVEQNKAFVEPVATALPTERQIEQLAKKTLKDFDTAVKAGDFEPFFKTTSDRWKFRGKDPRALIYTDSTNENFADSDPLNKADRLTIPELQATFGPFTKAKVDLSPVQAASMKLTEPIHLSSDGILTAKGDFDCYVFQSAFPPIPCRINFKLEYVFESSSWKLFGIAVNLLPKGE